MRFSNKILQLNFDYKHIVLNTNEKRKSTRQWNKKTAVSAFVLIAYKYLLFLILDKEMSHYLSLLYEKTGLNPQKFRQVGDIDLINTNNHLQELYYVEPLVMCYEETIHLLKTELDDMKEDSELLKKHSEEIIKENNFLRKELESKINYITKCEQVGINTNFLKLDNSDLNEKLAILNKKNAYLLQKNKELEEALDTAEKENKELYTISDIKKVTYDAEEGTRTLSVEIIDMKKSMSVLVNQLANEESLKNSLE